MEPSCAMPEDAQAGKCVGEELVDLQDGQSGAIRSIRDLSENLRVHVKTFECPAPFGSLQRLGAALEGVLVLVTFLWIPACCLPSTLLG